MRREHRETVCARVAYRTAADGCSSSPLEVVRRYSVPLLVSAVFALAASTLTPSQEVQMSGLAFHLPVTWTVRTDGHYAAVGSLSSTFNPALMPWVTVNLCDNATNHPCPAKDADLSRDKSCPTLKKSLHEWANGIKETRWVCPLMVDRPGVKYSSSVTTFEIGSKKLLLYYLATDHDTPPDEFLDDFAKALRTE